jgi:hypothetical protein
MTSKVLSRWMISLPSYVVLFVAMIWAYEGEGRGEKEQKNTYGRP